MSQEKLFQKQEPTIQMQKEREDLLIDLKQEPFMMENGLVDSEMDLGFKNGQTVLVMKVSGKMILKMGKENIYLKKMDMYMYLRACGKMD